MGVVRSIPAKTPQKSGKLKASEVHHPLCTPILRSLLLAASIIKRHSSEKVNVPEITGSEIPVSAATPGFQPPLFFAPTKRRQTSAKRPHKIVFDPHYPNPNAHVVPLTLILLGFCPSLGVKTPTVLFRVKL